MNCRDLQADLQAYLDGELSPVRRGAIESHIAQCAECRRVLAELETVSKSLRGWGDHKVSDKFELSLYSKLAGEPGFAKPAAAATKPAESRGSIAPAYRFPSPKAFKWFLRGWRPVAIAATILVAVVAFLARDESRPIRRVIPGQKPTVMTVLAGSATNTQIADAWLYAGLSGKRAIGTPSLEVSQVVSSDIVAEFLATAESDFDHRVGVKLMNILAGGGHWKTQSSYARSWTSPLPGLFVTAFAAARPADPLSAARQLELEGRYTEAFAAYKTAAASGCADRASLGEGALRLRLGELDSAQVALGAASGSTDKVVALTASELLGEIGRARAARDRVAAMRTSARSGEDWMAVALAEVEACDYRNAANSFIKAASLTDPAAGSAQARFRSAWCQREIGQISTSVYGFKAVAEEPAAPAAVVYAAGVEQAIGLARIGRYAESVQVSGETIKRAAPNPSLEAFLYFHKGLVELRGLGDAKAASASFGVVSSAGQGNLSYAAVMLEQSIPK